MALLHNAVLRGALAGMGAAAVVDLHAFVACKRLDDLITYDWRTALLRWVQGAITGAVTGAGLGTIS